MAKTTNPLMSATASGTFGKMTTYRELGGRGIASMHRRSPTIDNSPEATNRRARFAIKRAIVKMIDTEAERGGWIDLDDGIVRDTVTLAAKYLGASWREIYLGNQYDREIDLEIFQTWANFQPDPSRIDWDANAANPRIARAPTAMRFEFDFTGGIGRQIINRWQVIRAISDLAPFGNSDIASMVSAPSGTDRVNNGQIFGVYGINESSRRSAAFRI